MMIWIIIESNLFWNWSWMKYLVVIGDKEMVSFFGLILIWILLGKGFDIVFDESGEW